MGGPCTVGGVCLVKSRFSGTKIWVMQVKSSLVRVEGDQPFVVCPAPSSCYVVARTFLSIEYDGLNV